MENKLPGEQFRPVDEYPALGAKPIDAAEPAPKQAPAPPAQPVTAQPATAQPATAQPTTAPVGQPVKAPSAPTPQVRQQNTQIPYMTYPMFPPMPGMPQFPQQQFPQQGVQQQYPQQGMQQQYPQQGMQQQYPQQGMQQQYPQQGMQQQYPQQGMQQQYPFRYPDYTQYFAPGAQQQQNTAPAAQPTQGYVPPAMPSGQQTFRPSGGNPAYSVPPAGGGVVPDEKKPASTGTKAFLIILSALMLAMIVGFIVYIAGASRQDNAESRKPQTPSAPSIGDKDNGVTPPQTPNLGSDDIDLKHTETEAEITLVADNGATQKRDDDNPDSVGKPDKNAKGIELKAQPKDADDTSKHTAKSSFNTLADSVVTIICFKNKISDNLENAVSSGSGTIISADGYIITNAHVLNNSRYFAVQVTLNDGKKYQATIVGYDTWTDLAVLKIDAKDLKPAAFGDSQYIEVGDEVITIGSPGGMKYQNTLTQGVVSALDREISTSRFVRYIQSDAAINPGSSGGPLCNLYGQVVGITTAKTIASNYENMSFSIPSSLVKEIVADLLHYGYIPDRTRIGFAGNEIPSEYTVYYGIPSGVIVSEIADDGALKDSDVKRGDIITEIDGTKINSFQDIYNILAKHKSGDKIKLKIYRLDNPGLLLDDDEPAE